jgi:hypothetical protein
MRFTTTPVTLTLILAVFAPSVLGRQAWIKDALAPGLAIFSLPDFDCSCSCQ